MSGSGARRKSIRRGVKKTCRWHVFSLRSRRLYPVAVPKILLRHLSRQNFDRCHSLTSLFLPLAALGSLPAVASIWFCTHILNSLPQSRLRSTAPSQRGQDTDRHTPQIIKRSRVHGSGTRLKRVGYWKASGYYGTPFAPVLSIGGFVAFPLLWAFPVETHKNCFTFVNFP